MQTVGVKPSYWSMELSSWTTIFADFCGVVNYFMRPIPAMRETENAIVSVLLSNIAGSQKNQWNSVTKSVKCLPRTVAFFKIGGQNAKSAGIFASQSRDEYDADDVAHVSDMLNRCFPTKF